MIDGDMNFEEGHSEEIFLVEVQFVGCQGLCEQGKFIS